MCRKKKGLKLETTGRVPLFGRSDNIGDLLLHAPRLPNGDIIIDSETDMGAKYLDKYSGQVKGKKDGETTMIVNKIPNPKYYKEMNGDGASWTYFTDKPGNGVLFQFTFDHDHWKANYCVAEDMSGRIALSNATQISASEFETAFFKFRFSLNSSVGVIDTKPRKG